MFFSPNLIMSQKEKLFTGRIFPENGCFTIKFISAKKILILLQKECLSFCHFPPLSHRNYFIFLKFNEGYKGFNLSYPYILHNSTNFHKMWPRTDDLPQNFLTISKCATQDDFCTEVFIFIFLNNKNRQDQIDHE